ncbi:hypothetical protein [Actinophytocola sediminis]
MTSPADSDVNEDVEALDPPAADEKPASRPKLPTIVLSSAVVLLVAALGVAGWFGVSWINAANDDSMKYSGARDDVDRVARAAIDTMNTLDYRKLDDGLADWSNVTTGTLNQEITALTAEDKKSLQDAKWVADSEVRSLAVRELDERSGKAVVIAAVQTTVSIGGGEPKSDFKRVEGTLLRTDTGWKLDVLTPVQSAQPQQPVPPSR